MIETVHEKPSQDARLTTRGILELVSVNTCKLMCYLRNQPRTEGAIAFYPTGSLQGSVRFLLVIATGKVITRDNRTRLPVSQEMVQHMYVLAVTAPTNDALLLPNTEVTRADALHNSQTTVPAEPIH